MSRASSDSNIWDSQGNTQLPYVRDPSTLSPVPSRVPQEASGPSTRERTDVRRSEAHNRMCDCTSSSHIQECNELEYGAKVNFGRMGFELWLVHALFSPCIISQLSTLLPGIGTISREPIRGDEILLKVNQDQGASDTAIWVTTV